MRDHPLNSLTESALENIRKIAQSSTIIGDPIAAPNGTSILPVCKVKIGFVGGGSDLPTATNKELFGGGNGSGVMVEPVAFLVIGGDGRVQLLQLAEKNNSTDRLINMLPDVVDQVSRILKKDGAKSPKDPDITINVSDAPEN